MDWSLMNQKLQKIISSINQSTLKYVQAKIKEHVVVLLSCSIKNEVLSL